MFSLLWNPKVHHRLLNKTPTKSKSSLPHSQNLNSGEHNEPDKPRPHRNDSPSMWSSPLVSLD